jgi:hypothetical protein
MFDRELIEAELALDLIPSEKVPELAWQALEAGLDGRWIRRLASLERPTFFEVADVLPKAKIEMGLDDATVGKAALIVASRWAKEILERGEDPLLHTKKFEWLWIKAGYADEINSVGNLDDEVWIAESGGQKEAQIRKWVTERLVAISA